LEPNDKKKNTQLRERRPHHWESIRPRPSYDYPLRRSEATKKRGEKREKKNSGSGGREEVGWRSGAAQKNRVVREREAVGGP